MRKAAVLDGGELGRTRVRAEAAQGHAAVRRRQVDLRVEPAQPVQRERLGAGRLARHALTSCARDEVAEQRAERDGDEEAGVDEGRDDRRLGDALLDRGDLGADPGGDRPGLDGLAHDEAELQSRPQDVVDRGARLDVDAARPSRSRAAPGRAGRWPEWRSAGRARARRSRRRGSGGSPRRPAWRREAPASARRPARSRRGSRRAGRRRRER